MVPRTAAPGSRSSPAAGALCGILLVTSDVGPFVVPPLRLSTLLGATLFFLAFVPASRALLLVFRQAGREGQTR